MASSSFLPRALVAGVTGWLDGDLPATAAFSQLQGTWADKLVDRRCGITSQVGQVEALDSLYQLLL